MCDLIKDLVLDSVFIESNGIRLQCMYAERSHCPWLEFATRILRSGIGGDIRCGAEWWHV